MQIAARGGETPRFALSLRQLCVLARTFWRKPFRSRDSVLLVAVIILNLGQVGIVLLTTFWQRLFFNALEAKDWSSFLSLLISWDHASGYIMPGFALILLVSILMNVYAVYLQQALQIRWRERMTDFFLKRWLSRKAYYRLRFTPQHEENFDQRISEDINLFVDNTLTLGMGLLRTVVSLISFILLLWTLSAEVSFFGHTIPGSLVWISLIYAGLGTGLGHLAGRRLIGLKFAQQGVEADFRFRLMRVREHAEEIALYAAESNELERLKFAFGRIRDNWREIMHVTRNFSFLNSGFNQGTLVIPLIVAAPAFFAGKILLGEVFQIANSLNAVLEGFTWILTNYVKLTEYSAASHRLTGFLQAIGKVRPIRAEMIRHEGPAFELRECSIYYPTGGLVLGAVNLVIAKGECVLLTGPSGAGKSMLLRTLAGVWPFATGSLDVPRGRRMFLPSKPYVPIGNLRQALLYPETGIEVSDGHLGGLLAGVGMSHLADRLSQDGSWQTLLSNGEVQRLALARILVIRPDWLFLDEATSNLDAESERSFYSLLREHLPGTACVIVSHRPDFAEHFDRHYHVMEGTLMRKTAI